MLAVSRLHANTDCVLSHLPDCASLLLLQDLYSFCGFVMVLQLAMFMAYALRVAQYPHSTASVVKHAADVVISAVPTGIPTVIIFSMYRCGLTLMSRGMAVLQTSMINVAADVDTAVFDKTGTLTDSVVCTCKAEYGKTHFCMSSNRSWLQL